MKYKSALITNILLILIMFALSIWAWEQLPADSKIPVHFGLTGSPDGYAAKLPGLLFFPLLAVVTALVNAGLPQVALRKHSLENSEKTFSIVSVAITAFCGGLHLIAIATAYGTEIDFTTTVGVLAGIFLIAIGISIGQLRRKSYLDVHMPWTVKSELAWYRIYPLGAGLLVLDGIVFIIAGLQSNTQLLSYSCIGVFVICLLILPLYSYFIRKDNSANLTD